MANRQYVGARYVPTFYDNNGSNEWVKGVAYEPLTIVTYLNNSYTSKVPVPAGTGNPAEATEYWVLTGNYNAQVDSVQQSYNEISETLDVVNSVIPKFNVKDYGAIGDGVTDDTTAIQNAINDCINATTIYNSSNNEDVLKGGVVYFPSGIYLTSNSLQIDQNISLVGECKTSTCIKNTVSDFITTKLNTTALYNNSFKNLAFVGGSRGNVVFNLWKHAIVRCTFEDLEFRTASSDCCILGSHGWDNSFNRIHTKGTTCAIMFVNLGGDSLNNTSFYDCSFLYANRQCVAIMGTDINFYSCNFERNNNYGNNFDSNWFVAKAGTECRFEPKCGVYSTGRFEQCPLNFYGCWFEALREIDSIPNYGVYCGDDTGQGEQQLNFISCHFNGVSTLWKTDTRVTLIGTGTRQNFNKLNGNCVSINSYYKPTDFNSNAVATVVDFDGVKGWNGSTALTYSPITVKTLALSGNTDATGRIYTSLRNKIVVGCKIISGKTIYPIPVIQTNNVVALGCLDATLTKISSETPYNIEISYIDYPS